MAKDAEPDFEHLPMEVIERELEAAGIRPGRAIKKVQRIVQQFLRRLAEKKGSQWCDHSIGLQVP